MRGRKTSASDTNAYNQSNPQLAERFNVSVPLTVTWLIVPTAAPLSSSESPQSGLYGFNSETSSFSASPFLKVEEKKMHIYVFRSQPLLFVCVCQCTLPPTVSECAHEEGSADMQRGRETARRSEKIQTISRWFLSPGLSSLVSFTFHRSSERRSEGFDGP